jgi:hypothetical protein
VASSETLSKELETLLALVRNAPNVVPPSSTPVSDAAAHDRMLATLLAGAGSVPEPKDSTAPAPAAVAIAGRPFAQPAMPYAPPLATHVAPAPAASAETAKLPATWYSPPQEPAEPWFGSELRAGALGLGLGVLIIAPVLLVTGGWWPIERFKPRATVRSEPQERSLSTTQAQEKVSALAAGKIEIQAVRRELIPDIVAPSAPAVPPPAGPAASGPPPPPAETSAVAVLSEANKLIELGDIHAARDKLSNPALAGRAEAQFVLAETYDPNVLAAWGTRGVSADVERARALYQLALGLGHVGARERLRGLQ